MRQPDMFRVPKKPWNAGRIGPKAPLKPKYIWAIRQQLKTNGRRRDLAMFNCAIDAKLRACDLVRLTVSDVAPGGVLRTRSTVIQQKTGRPVPFEITEPTREALVAWLAVRGRRADDWLFPSRNRRGDHITTCQYARLVDRWVKLVDLEPGAYGTHSLRRTKVALVYKKTSNLRGCRLLIGHRKLESTVRPLGIEVDDALELSEQLEI
ncbi:MAG TPA: tyrosine-type recombinase/integrase [Phenylobacterium sp.]